MARFARVPGLRSTSGGALPPGEKRVSARGAVLPWLQAVSPQGLHRQSLLSTPGHHGGGFSSGVSMKKRIYTADLAALLNVSLRTLSRLSSRGIVPTPAGRSLHGGHYWLAGDPALKRFIADQRRPGRASDGVR